MHACGQYLSHDLAVQARAHRHAHINIVCLGDVPVHEAVGTTPLKMSSDSNTDLAELYSGEESSDRNTSPPSGLFSGSTNSLSSLTGGKYRLHEELIYWKRIQRGVTVTYLYHVFILY